MKKLYTIFLIMCLNSLATAEESMIGQVNGMMCIKCQNMVTEELIKASPTAQVKVSWPEGVAVSAFKDNSNLSLEEFKKAISDTGFEVVKVIKTGKFIIDAGEARKLVE